MSKNKESTNPAAFLTTAIRGMRSMQNNINKDQQKLLEKTATIYNENKEVNDNFTQLVIDRVKLFKKASEDFNESLNKLKADNKDDYNKLPFGVRSNKALDIATHTLETIEKNPNIIDRLCKGTIPFDSSITKSLPSLTLEENENYWGTSKVTITSFLLKQIHDELAGESLNYDDYPAIFHPFDAGSVQESPYYVIHSGYSWGGDRASTIQTKPYDCTSMLEDVYQLPPNTASSADLVLSARFIDNPEYNLTIDAWKWSTDTWKESPSYKLTELLNTHQNPEVGDIVALRRFNEKSTQENSLGTGGHGAIFVGNDNGHQVVIEYTREMPNMEGFGIRYKKDGDEQNTNEVHYLIRNNDGLDLSKLIDAPEVIMYDINNPQQTLDTLTEYADCMLAGNHLSEELDC